ncbi:MAG: radical SAM/Cys-rich domain protein [Gammaproteobacteria bacterium]|nr:MAG: radical SAM/Cys-rich domain protein [Gammaproteobacteria bacterium]
MRPTLPLLEKITFPPLYRDTLQTLQVNLGYRCNQSCLHCHVNAGPKRTEEMSRETIDLLLKFLQQHVEIRTLDLTGGAPEMNRHFRHLVEQARKENENLEIIDRCNLTILEEPDQANLASFLAKNRVTVTASLPCYMEDNVDRQRGNGVFQSSIRGLKQLNSLGYGQPNSGLILNLVYNPQGPNLPPGQQALEQAYKTHLHEEFGIVFNHLFTLANMPIQRFGSTLISRGEFEPYMELLKKSYNADTLNGVMCRTTLSVDWQGYLYDCDFNQMLGLPAQLNGNHKTHIRALKDVPAGTPITVRGHCYGCTAGQGSSCGGALKQ